jgi:hypothetical protein
MLADYFSVEIDEASVAIWMPLSYFI